MDLLLKYKHIFAENDSDLGMAQEFYHQIHLEDPNPIRQRAIRRSPASEAIVEEEISKLVEKGLLIPSKSPWASPVLIVKKKDGTNRVVMDYRKLNNIIVRIVTLYPESMMLRSIRRRSVLLSYGFY